MKKHRIVRFAVVFALASIIVILFLNWDSLVKDHSQEKQIDQVLVETQVATEISIEEPDRDFINTSQPAFEIAVTNPIVNPPQLNLPQQPSENRISVNPASSERIGTPGKFADLATRACASNLYGIFDAAARVAKESKPVRLPTNLMMLRSEFTNASILLCPSDPVLADAFVDWNLFDPNFISYQFHRSILSGAQDPKVGIDYRYLSCPIHEIRLSGNRQVSGKK